VLTFNNISIIKDGIKIVRNFGVTAFAGCALNIYGSNGSGKSSLLKHIIALDITKPNEIFYNNTDIYPHIQEYRLMGEYIGHNLGLKESLTVEDNLIFWAKLYNTELLLEAAIYTLKLEEYLDVKISELSMGTKKRAALARLLITNSTLWFLDEPFANLDGNFSEIVLNMIRARCEQKGNVIFTSHAPMSQNFMSLYMAKPL